MRSRLTLLAASIALAWPVSPAAPQSASADPSLLGRWRISRAVVAPWIRGVRTVSPSRAWVGRAVVFEPNRVSGPGALRCGGAHYSATAVPFDGLFQSALTAPTADAAALGLVSMPVLGTRLRCDSGVFEFHRADINTMLVALDGVIYTLDRSSGAFAPDTSPSGVVQQLLERHLAGTMSFDSAHVAQVAPWLTKSLRDRIAVYLVTQAHSNMPPAVNGDPFTDSQVHPVRFSVPFGSVQKDVARVPVRFAYARRTRVVEYILRRENGAWRVNDLRFERRGTLGRLLQL